VEIETLGQKTGSKLYEICENGNASPNRLQNTDRGFKTKLETLGVCEQKAMILQSVAAFDDIRLTKGSQTGFQSRRKPLNFKLLWS
jgi:hypothetical protein